MMWPELQTVSQIAIGRILNSLPEGFLIALFAGAMLRFLPRQNSRTRFSVWFVALVAVAGLPLIGSIAGGHSLAAGVVRPLITVPAPWGLLLFLAWFLAAGFAIAQLAFGLWRLRTLRRSCLAINGTDLDPAIRKTVADFSSARSLTLATSEQVSVPAALGFFKPMIVIPAWALRELSPEELNIILLHEFAHLRRRDAWTNLLQKMVRAVFLFHPAVWWIENRLSLEREMACDDQVLAETANPRGYAKCLIGLLERSFARRGWAMAQAVVHRAHEASLRLEQILDVSRPETRRVSKFALGLVGTFSLVSLMAVPHAPQFVAFDRNPPIHSDDMHLAALSPSGLPSAAVIPAAMRTTVSSSLEKMPRHAAVQRAVQAIKRPAEHLSEPPSPQRRSTTQEVVALGSADSERTPAEIVTAAATQTVVPVSEALLLIQTTQRVGPNSWAWSLCVWRVTWINLNQDRVARAPVANKT
jgi:beta-lactamase regulating signal transducer with metallopeptidase domain